MSNSFLTLLMNVICWCAGDPVIYRFWKDNPQQQDRSTPNVGTAHMVETTAYALLTSLSLKDINYVNPIIKWLSEEQRYGGGFYSTQVTFLCLVLSSWRHLSCPPPHPLHVPCSFWPPYFCPPNACHRYELMTRIKGPLEIICIDSLFREGSQPQEVHSWS